MQIMAPHDGICLVCHRTGRHFIPPSMGKFGYYLCQEDGTGRDLSKQG